MGQISYDNNEAMLTPQAPLGLSLSTQSKDSTAHRGLLEQPPVI